MGKSWDCSSRCKENMTGWNMYEGHFRSNINVPVTVPHFVHLYIAHRIVQSETKHAC